MANRLIPDRRQMEHLASPVHIGLMCFLSLGCAALFLAVLLASHFHVWGFSDQELAVIDKLPVSVVYLCVGIGGFCLFFPFFLALTFLRYLLLEVARLEAR